MGWKPGTRRLVNAIAAIVLTGILLLVAAVGVGPLPPLGSAFNPGTGVWTAAADARLPHGAVMHLAGLQGPVQVIYERNGTAHIVAATDHDLFLTLGYLHAQFRLFEMDLLRRQGEGLLAQVVGPAALPFDEFERKLGLQRTAQAEWNATAHTSKAYLALTAYTQGVNTRIAEDERTGNLPLMTKLLGYRPALWTPVDSLVIQGDMAQTLAYDVTTLDYALLVKSLGYTRTMQWFPLLPPNEQHPYDPGPYTKHTPAPLPAQLAMSTQTTRAIADLAGQMAALPQWALHRDSNSNNWAVSGARTESGKPLLAGDPHLHQTLPSIWYQIGGDAPSYHFDGVSIPGTPVILIGHNQHISWSLTNTQNQATLFYVEKTDSAHPHQYFWNGAWRRMTKVSYDIPVKGGGTDHLDVYLSVHGPIVTDDSLPGRSIAIDWIGGLPSPDLEVMLSIMQASAFGQFRAALRDWHAPSQNFVYADDKGNIGLISAGYYPLVKSGAPWLPLPGTGESDIVGTIPFDDVPQVYNPPSGLVFSANQRPVGPSYPYYIGATWGTFDNGYRADRIYQVLHDANHLSARDMEKLQTDTHDYLATLIVPKLLDALKTGTLTARQSTARALLQGWDGNMAVDSPAASIWWTFWTHYLTDTFGPWWNAYHVPAKKYSELAVGPAQAPLDEDLEAWTLHDPTNAAFTPPHGAARSAPQVMRQAFAESVDELAKKLGADPRTWRWGRLHAREFESLAQVESLSYGPRPSSGDEWTVNAANGSTATHGPSWRFVMDWGAGAGEGVYPGGQSENPLSPWYENQVETWWDGRYYPMRNATAARTQPDSVTWTLIP